ncbi:hypothetical protein LSG25_02450 [Paralcaligenes sp. KSB-10]|nr:hypothetical protein [Paralcaligenes sp. KSB-10]UHL64787.1 hypothetical protein LSG25_02450 [Paralcaligenes sp. KSB-10]
MKANKLLLVFLVVIAAVLSGCAAGDGTYNSGTSPMTNDTGNGGGGY